MPNREQEPKQIPEAEATSPLPAELSDFLRDKEYACVMHSSDKGTVFIIKAPHQEIESMRGRVPIEVRHELFEHPAAPVIRTVITIYDQPDRPLALESFTNVEDKQQRSEFAALATQGYLHLLFYDESVKHRLTKQVRNTPGTIPWIVQLADDVLARIPKDKFDFDKGKADVIARTKLLWG